MLEPRRAGELRRWPDGVAARRRDGRAGRGPSRGGAREGAGGARPQGRRPGVGLSQGRVRDRELATALAGKPLVAGAAAQLIRLWRDDFDVYEEDGRYKVAARDGRTVARSVADWLASPEYSHFCLPSSRGGTGARDRTGRRAGGAPRPPEEPRRGGRHRSGARSPPRGPTTLLKPIGLRRRR